MNRRTAEAFVLAVLAVVALAAAAATLPSATTSGGGSGDGPPGPGRGTGGLLPPSNASAGPAVDLSFLRPLLLALVVIAALVLLVYAFLYRREAFRALVGLVALVAVIALLFWLASTIEPAARSGLGLNGSLLGAPAGSAGERTPTPPPLALLVVVGLVLVGAVAVLLRSGSTLAGRFSREAAPGDEHVEAVGRAAGRAADRIESTGDLDNEIYRAWREMTGLLSVSSPESNTPGEFAAAAVEAGMAPDDVSELTRLFEDVRYGGDEPTETNERRALSILRRVEETYVPDEGVDGRTDEYGREVGG